jgi:modulator of FtsH protease HflK
MDSRRSFARENGPHEPTEPDLKAQKPYRFSPFKLLFVILAAWSLWTSWYIVGNGKNSVVQRFGAYTRTEDPGLRFKLPYPVEKATIVNVEEVQRVEIGFRTKSVGPPAEYDQIPEESEMLTGNMNIVELDFTVQYRRTNAKDWLITAENPEEAIRLLAQSAMRMVVGTKGFDEVATTGRANVQNEAKAILIGLVQKMNLGITIVAVQLQDAHPPKKVMPSFKDVNDALEEKQGKILAAEKYRNEQLPKARGNVKKIEERSAAYKEERVRFARGDAAVFTGVLAKYRQAPQITLERLRLETLEVLLPGRNQLIDLSGSGLVKYFDAQSFGPIVPKEKK